MNGSGSIADGFGWVLTGLVTAFLGVCGALLKGWRDLSSLQSDQQRTELELAEAVPKIQELEKGHVRLETLLTSELPQLRSQMSRLGEQVDEQGKDLKKEIRAVHSRVDEFIDRRVE